MIRINLLMTCWATFTGVTAYADSCDLETTVSEVSTAAAPEEEPSDPFAAALAILNHETSAPESAGSEMPPLEDYLHPEGQNSVSSAALADGKVSSFQLGAEGAEKVTVSADGGLWVGATAVDSHVIEIAENGEIAAGTYTLIDYEGAIGGAGFKGLTLRGAPHLHAKLVNNTAETKIELVVSDVGEQKWPNQLSDLWTKLTRLASAMKPSV